MICARCGDETPEQARCTSCGEAPRLRETYRLDAVVGRGASGVTYRATRLSDARTVCIKELLYGRMQSFKEEDRFHREAETLRQLRHPAIPDYLDEFTEEHSRSVGIYLVQEFVEGENLREEMAHRRYREEEALEIVAELADVLEYLHRLRPPVIHRDIKPSNVMRRASDGRLLLVDFGSVKNSVGETTMGGTTVAGTFGYMAPEQLYGRASAASDLYGLGVLALVLLTRRQPDQMLDSENRLDWKRRLEVHPQTEALLERLLQPDPDRREKHARNVGKRAREILAALRAPTPTREEIRAQERAERERRMAEEEREKARRREEKAQRQKEKERLRGRTQQPSSEAKKRWVPVILSFFAIGGVTVGAFLYKRARSQPWGSKGTYYCHSGDERVVRDKTVRFRGRLLSATGTCNLTLVNCRLVTSSGEAIHASRKARITMRGGYIEARRTAIRLSGDARMVLRNVKVQTRPRAQDIGISYRAAIRVEGSAQLVMVGGEIDDPEQAIQMRGHAIVALQQVKTRGRVSGRVRRIPAGVDAEREVATVVEGRRRAAALRERKIARFASVACRGVADCFQSHGVTGYVVGRISMWVDRSGGVTPKRIQAGDAPPAIVACLEKAGRAIQLPAFDGTTGTLECRYSGEVGRLRLKPSFR